jgi:hypothetical protein
MGRFDFGKVWSLGELDGLGLGGAWKGERAGLNWEIGALCRD